MTYYFYQCVQHIFNDTNHDNLLNIYILFFFNFCAGVNNINECNQFDLFTSLFDPYLSDSANKSSQCFEPIYYN